MKKHYTKSMLRRLFFSLSIAFLGASCRPDGDAFVQGDIRILPPVRLVTEGSVGGVRFINDGGSTWITIVDSVGKRFDVYFDRRIRSTHGKFDGFVPGTIYLNAYPSNEKSVLVDHQAEFREKILKCIDQDIENWINTCVDQAQPLCKSDDRILLIDALIDGSLFLGPK